MKMTIRVIENGEIIERTVGEILQKYDNLIYKICRSWIKSFKFDKSIELEDLAQDLRLKFLNDLHNYDCMKNEYIISYMRKIAKNFFITQKAQITKNDRYPTDCDSNPEFLISLYKNISKDANEVRLIDTIISHRNETQTNIEIKYLVRRIQYDLDKISYKPKNFTKRLRSFCRVVFDTIYYQDEKFTEFVRFHFRCRQRVAKNSKNRSIPRTVLISAEAIAVYLNVTKSAINYANKQIRDVVIKNVKEEGEK